MALQTKTFIGTTSSPTLWTWKIEVIENSINEDNNTSSVTVNNYLGRVPSSGSYFSGSATMSYSAGGQNFGENKSYGETTIGAGQYVLMGSHTFTIEHTSEPMNIGASGSMSNATFNPNTASADGTMTLTEIIQGILRLRVNGAWKKATAYLRVNGTWKKCKAYLRLGNAWKKGE